ncbi:MULTISPECIES: type 2 lanthipeptide synthetase LanM family protein [unclassified Kitasatospora]|uniref:type 2 lanthipeptide synthetase LanM family protein n=1 Tax=unclassified Kitasatospora TaxID=2633591 RepID=UPI0024770603|nr:type 2 lanthipeptide synthetase LanM family protein [Kitasatospora sp. MAP12-44]
MAAAGADAWWARALSGGERFPADRPDWAAFVDETLAVLRPAPRPPAGELPGITGFVSLLTPLAEHAAERLSAQTGGPAVDLTAVRAAFVPWLARVLTRRSARTLVLELNVARVSERLVGDTASDRFRDFVALMSAPQSLTSLFAEYPVLARLLGRVCLDAVTALAELLGRFDADRVEIVAALFGGADPGCLVAVDAGAGDGHQRGRSVAVLRFADGRRVVYKPRPLGMHRHFNEVAGWFNARPGAPGLPVLGLLERDGYGWVEHVTHQPCATPEELERFYRRQGALLALLYALDGTDLHCENLIARGDEPVLIDVETLFHPVITTHGAEDPAAAALRASVYRTGLLPQLLVGDRTALDASGLGGDTGVPLPVDSVGWADAGTDRMRLVRQAGTFAGAANRPWLAGTQAEPAAHTDALLAGFRAGYRAVVAGRDELLGPSGLLRRFAADVARVVLRPTRTYATLLAEATHPDVLRDAAAKDALLGLLGTDELAGPGHPALLDDELAQLWDDDIPLFTTRPGTPDLWSGTGARIPGALTRPGLDAATDRIRAMGEEDRRAQEWIIRAAMAARSTAPPHPSSAAQFPSIQLTTARPPTGPAPERMLAAARSIGDRLVELAHQRPTRVNWLDLELLGDRYWQLRPCGADLGGGFTGVALFLAQLAGLTGSDRYAQLARRALQPLPGLLERLADGPKDAEAVGPGGFAGLGGIAYAVSAVADALDDREIGALTAPAIALTVSVATPDTTSGVLDGLAGGLAALLAIHRSTGSAEAWRGAMSCAAELAARPLPPEAGMHRGAAGVGWALLGFASDGGGARYERAGLAALRTAAERVRGDSWCQGLPGLALAVADRPIAAADPLLRGVVERAVRELARAAPAVDHSLCHGELGGLELLTRLSDPVSQAVRHRRADLLLAAVERDGPSCGAPGGLVVPGLLTGLAGIGHGLLRLGFPGRTASALLLHAEPGHRI